MATLPRINYSGIRVQNLYYNGQEIYNLTIDGQIRYHKHSGNKDNGGGCYTIAVQHRHQGNSNTNGGCYTNPVYHTHTDQCYPSHTVPACTWGGWVQVGSTVAGSIPTWRATCSCGAVQTGSIAGGGQPSGIHIPEHIEYDTTQPPICGRAGTIDHYDVSCGKSEATIEYFPGCGFDET